MIGWVLEKLIGTQNDRLLKRTAPFVQQINALEPEISKLSDTELRAKTDIFRDRLKNNETLEAILPEAFAVVRETGKRVLKMRHFDSQLVGGMILHQGK